MGRGRGGRRRGLDCRLPYSCTRLDHGQPVDEACMIYPPLDTEHLSFLEDTSILVYVYIFGIEPLTAVDSSSQFFSGTTYADPHSCDSLQPEE